MTGVYDVEKIRALFPQLQQPVHGKRLAYLDNAASTLKPQPVIDAIVEHYAHGASNVHRGVHFHSEQATTKYEEARAKARRFINAAHDAEIIFTSGTTSGINYVARCFGEKFFTAGDEIIITEMEHHANIVPWQMLRDRKGVNLVVVPVRDDGSIDLAEVESRINAKTRLVSIVGISNSLGVRNPVEGIIEAAHKRDVPVLIDGAQMVAHETIDVQKLDADFFVFSGHKLFGPTGIGVLYGKRVLLDKMDPLFGGGDMIDTVTFERTTYAELPSRLEAGTPHIEGVIGLGAAIDYVQEVGVARMAAHEHDLLVYAQEQLRKIDNFVEIGTAEGKAAVISFTFGDVHPHDIGSILDQEGVAVRTGHHCCQPLMRRFGVVATTRASFSHYNTREDVDQLVAGLKKVQELFG